MTESTARFPEVQPGGSLLIAWQLKGKKVLVVGGGEVAAGRVLACLNADALVTVVCPSAGLCPEVAYRVARGQVTHVDRKFDAAIDLEPPPPATDTPNSTDGTNTSDSPSSSNPEPESTPTPAAPAPALVLTAISDAAVSRSIAQRCRALRIPVNVADSPPDCDFFFGSVHRDGPVQVLVSTNGRGPRLASTLRQFLAAALPRGAGRAVERIGVLRARLREVAPRAEDGPARMRWVSGVSDRFGLEQLGALTDEDVDNLLRCFPEGRVPQLEELMGMRKGGLDGALAGEDVFDGSFGFSVGG